MPLKDIDVTLIDDDAETALLRMDARVEELERRIRFEQAVINEHRSLRAWFERMAGKEEDWFVTDSEELLFLPHTSQRNFLKDKRIYDILGDWLSMMPMVKSCMAVPAPHDQDGQLHDYSWGLIVPASVAREFCLPVNDVVTRLPPRKTFYYHFSGKDWPQLNPRDLLHSGVHKKMSQLGLTPAGDIYMVMLMYTRINTDSPRYGYYAVPIE